MSSVLRHLATTVVVGLTLAVGACGGSDSSTDASESGGSSASGATSNEQDSSQVKLAQCLREQGLDVPDTQGHGAFAQLSAAERKRLEAALQGPCREYQSGAFGDGSEPQSQDFLDAITAFTVCLRKQGVDVPDPDPASPFTVLHSIDQSDPKVADAAAACQDKLSALNGGG